MTSDHHSLQGAGMQHSPAPPLPLFEFCEICGEADEQSAMVEGMCRECLGVVREGIRLERERRFDWPFAVVVAVIAAVIVWRWVR